MSNVHPEAVPKIPRLETRRLPGRVNEALRHLIALDAFPNGRLPREDELAAHLAVSRTTLRAALRSLEEQGLITRVRGVGTRINHHIVHSAIPLNHVVGFYQLIEEAGYTPEIAWTRMARVVADTEVESRLGQSPSAAVLAIERLFLADGIPALHLTEHVSEASLLTIPTHPKEIPHSIFDFANEYCGTQIDHTVVELLPSVVDETTAENLCLSLGTPYLRLIETHYSLDNAVLIVSRINVRDDRLRFMVVRRGI